ncbi:MAG: prephenate dehydrogenase [Sphaerochaetaceae bacterium]|nr:prephenate dehydrogenase [Sphaerochaetaceae bacterium]
MVFGIVGLGLMGGSFAKVIKKNKIATKIYGYDHNISHQKEALELGFVDEIVNHEKLKEVDVLILAIPVDGIISFLNDFGELKNNTTIIDFGSTKELIVKNVPEHLKKNFIPAHPMTGTEKFGPKAAKDGLYEDKIIVLCDLDACDEIHKKRAIDIFEKVGMRLVFMNSKVHDVHACYISHLPHAISYALANTVMDNEDPKDIVTLAAGGFRDMSRIAKSSPSMWSDIFRQNRGNLIESMNIYMKHLNEMKTYLENEDYEKIIKKMEDANKLHEVL